MTYRSLPEHLESTAELVRLVYLKSELGLLAVKIEEPIHRMINFRPTLSVRTPDHYVLCVEVSEVVMPTPIWSFIHQCEQQHYPVLLYVAIASDGDAKGFTAEFAHAKESGVGVLEVDYGTKSVTVLNDPLSLSLTGLRPLDMKRFPPKYRKRIRDAVNTFWNGAPNKGCSMIYDEIEALTRKVAIKAHNKGYCGNPLKNPKDLEGKMSWATLLMYLRDKLNRSAAKADGKDLGSLSEVMLNRIIGITPHRNESSHKPSSLKALRERDSRLRTRMESAIDILKELIDASKCLRV